MELGESLVSLCMVRIWDLNKDHYNEIANRRSQLQAYEEFAARLMLECSCSPSEPSKTWPIMWIRHSLKVSDEVDTTPCGEIS